MIGERRWHSPHLPVISAMRYIRLARFSVMHHYVSLSMIFKNGNLINLFDAVNGFDGERGRPIVILMNGHLVFHCQDTMVWTYTLDIVTSI